jgi:hypothetical protein
MDGLPALDYVCLHPGHEVWTGGGCRLERRETVPGVFLTVVSGRVEAGIVAPVLEHMEALLALPVWPRVYFDLEGVSGYDASLVDPVRTWTKAHRYELGPMHLYSRSRLVRAGVALANYKLRGILHSHRDRKSFEASLRQAMGRA